MKYRSRTERIPSGITVKETAKDIEVLDFIQRHFYVTSHEIHTYLRLKGLAKERNAYTLARLKDITHELGYVSRPIHQRNSDTFHYNYLLYQLTEAGKKALGHRLYQTPPIKGWEQHRYMQTRLTAWMELACLKRGMNFVHRNTIFGQAKNPALKLEVNGVPHIPDDIFGVSYGDKTRFFALEADRATEDLGTIQKKIDAYNDLMQSKRFQDWGIDNITVLFVTLSAARTISVLKYIENKARYPKAFLLKAYPQFERPYTKCVDFYDVLEGEWLHTGGTYDIKRP